MDIINLLDPTPAILIMFIKEKVGPTASILLVLYSLLVYVVLKIILTVVCNFI